MKSRLIKSASKNPSQLQRETQLDQIDPTTWHRVHVGGKGSTVEVGIEGVAVAGLTEEYSSTQPPAPSTAKAGARGVAVVSHHGKAETGVAGVAVAGKRGLAIGGAAAIAVAHEGRESKARVGDGGIARIRGYSGTATAGAGGIASSEHQATVSAGHEGIASVGAGKGEGSAEAGNRGIASNRGLGRVKAGKEGVAIAWGNAEASAGPGGVIIFAFEALNQTTELIVGKIGENGLLANVPYILSGKQIVRAR